MEATMHEGKSKLSQLVERANAGEEVVLTKGKARTPVARIIPFDSASSAQRSSRPIGLYADEMVTGDYDWAEPMSEEELALWETPIESSSAINPSPKKNA